MSDKDTVASPESTTPAPAAEVKPRDYVLVQHLQRWAGSRELRASRSGHRRQGVILEDGSRIRRQGYRYKEISIQTLIANHQSILEHIREGRISVCTPDSVDMTYDEVVKLLESRMSGSGKKVEETSLKDAVVDMTAAVEIPTTDAVETPVVETPVVEAVEPAAPAQDATKPDIQLSEEIAVSDQFEAKKKGEANLPPSKRRKTR